MNSSKPSLKMAFCCPRFLWAGGGSVDFARRLAEELSVMGHDVTIFADECDEPKEETPLTVVQLKRDHQIEEKSRRRLDLANLRGFYRFANWLNRSGEHQLTASGPWCPALEDPKTFEDFDVVVLLNAASAWTVLFGRLLKKNPKALMVLVPFFHVREESGRWPLHRKLLGRMDLIKSCTEFETNWLKEQGWPAEKIQDVGGGADASTLIPDGAAFRRKHGIHEDAKIVLFLGRKIWNKGVIHVVQAMEHVWKENRAAVLVLMGFSHNTEDWLKSYTNKSSGKVVNVDNADEQDRENALAACTIMAAPSISDSFGIVYLDVWRHRKPVIACTETACSSLVQHEKNGFLVDFGDVPKIGNYLNRVLRSSEEAASIGQAGYDRWQTRYTWQEIARRTEDLFFERLEKKNKA